MSEKYKEDKRLKCFQIKWKNEEKQTYTENERKWSIVYKNGE